MCLLHVESQNKLRLMASITVCSSQIHCIAAIPQVTPKESLNTEEYFETSYSASEISYTPYNDARFESTSSFASSLGIGVDSDSDMVSSECSNYNNVHDDSKKLRRSTLGGSSESVQTLIGITETEEPSAGEVDRTSTGTLLADEVLSETGEKKKKKTSRKRRSSLQHEPASNPLPRRHFSLTARIQQSEKEFSSLQDINRSTSVPTVDYTGSNLSLCTETNFTFNEGSLSELSCNKQAVCPDKYPLDQHRPQSPLKKFVRMLSPMTPHRNTSASPQLPRTATSNQSINSNSRLSEYLAPKFDGLHTLRPKSVSTTFLDPVHYQQRSATLGRDHSRKQFSPMTLKPAHIKAENSQTTNNQKSKVGSSQMWLGTADKW